MMIIIKQASLLADLFVRSWQHDNDDDDDDDDGVDDDFEQPEESPAGVTWEAPIMISGLRQGLSSKLKLKTNPLWK